MTTRNAGKMAGLPPIRSIGACQKAGTLFSAEGQRNIIRTIRTLISSRAYSVQEGRGVFMGLLGQGAGPAANIQIPALLLKKCLFLEDRNQHGGTQIQILTESECYVGIWP